MTKDLRNVFHFLKLKLLWVRGLFPSPLPVGAQAFDAFFATICEVYSLPNLPSYKTAIASQIMHLPATLHKAPMWLFAKSIKKAMANQVAYQIIQDEREAQKKKEADEKAKAEAPQPA